MPALSRTEFANLRAQVSKRDQLLAHDIMKKVEGAVKVMRVRTPKDVQALVKTVRDLRGFAEKVEVQGSIKVNVKVDMG